MCTTVNDGWSSELGCFFFLKKKTAYEIEYGLGGSEMGIRDRPQPLIGRNREQPPVEPNATDVHRRINAGAHDGENRHGFRCAIHASAPFLPEQEENRGNQRPRVAGARPPTEVDDVPPPHRGMTVP